MHSIQEPNGLWTIVDRHDGGCCATRGYEHLISSLLVADAMVKRTMSLGARDEAEKTDVSQQEGVVPGGIRGVLMERQKFPIAGCIVPLKNHCRCQSVMVDGGGGHAGNALQVWYSEVSFANATVESTEMNLRHEYP